MEKINRAGASIQTQDIGSNVKKIKIETLPIKVVEIGERGEIYLLIGNLPASIKEPRFHLFEEKLVYLGTEDYTNASWEDLLNPDDMWTRGCSDDPRLLKIVSLIFGVNMDADPQPDIKHLRVGLTFDPIL
ncbi:MAG: hypothetical protein LBJ75_04555 [Puniceicoccales bacterium]|nr:hypothetical protein [Puniceicoccales bacterium]